MEAILIVDDDESVCAMLKETLAKPGRLVQSTNSDEEALALAEHSRFDVVVSDLNLGRVARN
jgi:CheY-like chemotaxis protein